MHRRVLFIARTSLLETLRSKLTPLAALALVLAVPLLSQLLGENEQGRVWVARSLTVEGFRVLLPIGVAVGFSFALRPAIRRGWATLSVRREEWFLGIALSGFAVVAMVFVLYAAGGILASEFSGSGAAVHRRQSAVSLTQEVRRQGKTRMLEVLEGRRGWMGFGKAESLVFDFSGPQSGRQVEGTLEFEIALTGRSAPARDAPFSVWLVGSDFRIETEVAVEATRRVSFRANVPGDGAWKVVCLPTDPAVIVGMYPSGCRQSVSSHRPAGTVIWLMLLSLAAALLTGAAVLMVRALATAPTAALAGILILTALTLLPAMTSPEKMARDRRIAVEHKKEKEDRSFLEDLERELSGLPELFPVEPFDNYLSGGEVRAEVGLDALLRLALALALLPAGAALFRLRQISD